MQLSNSSHRSISVDHFNSGAYCQPHFGLTKANFDTRLSVHMLNVLPIELGKNLKDRVYCPIVISRS